MWRGIPPLAVLPRSGKISEKGRRRPFIVKFHGRLVRRFVVEERGINQSVEFGLNETNDVDCTMDD